MFGDIAVRFAQFVKRDFLHYDRKIYIYSTSRTIWCLLCTRHYLNLEPLPEPSKVLADQINVSKQAGTEEDCSPHIST